MTDSPPAENAASQVPKIKRKALRWSRQPLIRLQVVACWAFVAFLLLITKSDVAWLWFKIASAAAVAFFLWPYIQGPYLLYTRRKVPRRANVRIIPAPADRSPQEYRVRDLAFLGFASAGHLIHDREVNVVAHIEMFLHPQQQDSACLTEIMSGLRTIHSIGFKSRFEDGFTFETNNRSVPGLFKPDPKYPVFKFPEVRSTVALYRLHRKMKEKFLLSHRPTLTDPEGELRIVIERSEFDHEHRAKLYCKLHPSGEHFVYTWKSATLFAWMSAWPVKQWRAMCLSIRSHKTAAMLGFRINPKFGMIEEWPRPRPASPDS